MTVDVDYGAGQVIYSVDASPAFTDPTSAQVQQRGDNVYGYLIDLEATADLAAEAALEKIQVLREFDAAVGSVTFVVPDAPNVTLQNMPLLPSLNLTTPNVERSDLDTGFQYDLTDAKNQSWIKPLNPEYVAPPKPGLTTPGTLPNAPASYEFPTVAPPLLEITSFSPTTVQAPQINLVDFEYTSELIIEPLDELVIDTSGLEKAIADFEDYDPTPPELPDYMYLIPQIFDVTGRMASGDTIVDYTRLLEARYELLASTHPSTALSISNRGLTPVAGAPQYDTWLSAKTHATLDTSDTVFRSKAANDAVETAFQLATAAHRMLVDIEVALYDLEFRAAKATVQGQLARAQAATAIYNANLLVFENAVANYNAQAATIVGAARAFEVQAREAGILAQANSVQADSFSAVERSKQVAGRVFNAQINAEAAKLTQYRAFLETYEAQVQSARIAVEQYSGDVARYSAEIDRLTSEYDLYSAEARTITSQNAALVAGVNANQAEFRSLATQADASAAETSARAVELQARAAVNETTYIKRALHSDEEGQRMNAASSDYGLGITEYVADLTGRTVEFSGKSALSRSITAYVGAASEAVGRAATLTQTANTTLARAYEQVYQAAGKAGAAVASGKLSGFRASATMAARETLGASRSYGVAYSGTGKNSYSESDNYNSSIGV